MISGLLGKKLGMTQIFQGGKCITVTIIHAGPCNVLQAKGEKSDGYNAIQLGYEEKKEARASKAEIGHAKKAELKPQKFVKEVAWDGKDELKPGGKVTVSIFDKIKYVDVTGTSKGKGFQGGMRRHGFSGGPKSHGQSDRLRAPGSIGCSASPARVFKGTKMPGHMGSVKRTARNLQIVDIDEKENLIAVKGSVPGPNDGYLIIKRSLIN